MRYHSSIYTKALSCDKKKIIKHLPLSIPSWWYLPLHGNLEKALDFFLKDLPYSREISNWIGESYTLNNTMRVHKTGDRNFPGFGYDNGDYYTDKTVFIGLGEYLKYLLAILNSKIGRYLIQLYVDKLDTGVYNAKSFLR